MCKHILNAQVAIRAPCCRRFFDCPLCHEEATNGEHRLGKTIEMQFVCKQCKRAFRKDLTRFEEEDEYCPHCDNHFVVEAQTPGQKAHAQNSSNDGDDEAAFINNLVPTTQDQDSVKQRTYEQPGHDIQALLDERMRYDPRRDWLARDVQAGQAGERIDEGGIMGVFQQRQQADRDAAQAARTMSTVMNAVNDAQSTSAGGAGGYNDDDLDWS